MTEMKVTLVIYQLKFEVFNVYALRWRHNGRNSVSNHQPQDCLLNRLFRRRSKKTSKLRVTCLCVGNSPGTGEFPANWWRHHGVCVLMGCEHIRLCKYSLKCYFRTYDFHIRDEKLASVPTANRAEKSGYFIFPAFCFLCHHYFIQGFRISTCVIWAILAMCLLLLTPEYVCM